MTHGDTAKGGRHQIGTLSGMKSEQVADFILEWMTNIIGILNSSVEDSYGQSRGLKESIAN